MTPPVTTADERSAPAAPPDIRFVMWSLFLSLVCLLLLKNIVSQSMFFDGLIYAGLARNLAEGVGSWWRLSFSATMFPIFTEHPPLHMWLQSLAFRVFGDSILVEKCFSLAMAFMGAVIVAGTWRELNRNDPGLRQATPLVLIFALLGGRTAWAYANNMLENLLFVFVGTSIYLTVRAYSGTSRNTVVSRLPYTAASGLAIGAAVMTKGLVGLFPLAAMGLYWLVYRRPGLVAVVIDSMVTVASLLLVIYFATSSPEARIHLAAYLDTQLFASLSGQRGYGGGGLSAISSLIEAFLKPAILTGLVIALAHLVNRKSGREVVSLKIGRERMRTAMFLTLVGISASFPILVSPRVYRFYFNPSAPFYCSALAVICAPILTSLMAKLGSKRLAWAKTTSIVILVASLGVVGWSTAGLGRDAAMLSDINKIGAHVCGQRGSCDEIIQTCFVMRQNYQFDSYMERLYKISVVRQEDATTAVSTSFAVTVPECPAPSPEQFTEVDLGLVTFKLYARRASAAP